MNNDLEQFSEERLKAWISDDPNKTYHVDGEDLQYLARIALAEKQSKPVAYMYLDNLHSDARFSLTSQIGNWSSEEISEYEIAEIPLYTTPQPAHTEQGEMPDKALSLSETIGELRKYIDSSGGYNFEALRSEQVNSPAIPDGWKLVPIEPTQEMVDACFEATSAGGIQKGYRAMLAAAPKPESE